MLGKCVENATLASANLPVAQAYTSILRACISQNVGYLIRVTPPRIAEDFARDIDGALVQTIKAIFRVEDIEGWQEELLFHPVQKGGWGLPSLTTTKECAYIAGTAVAPYILDEEIPGIYTQQFLTEREKKSTMR